MPAWLRSLPPSIQRRCVDRSRGGNAPRQALRLVAASLALCVPLVAARAQDKAGDPVPTLQSVRTPESPAFILLGISPTDIQQPTTPAAFAVSFLTGTRANGSSFLPKDYALQVAPFWLSTAARHLTFDEYERGGLLANLQRTFTLGFATQDSAFKTSVGGDTSVYRLGLGMRATPFRGVIAKPQCISIIRERAQKLASAVNMRVAQAIAADPTLANRPAELELLRAQYFREERDALGTIHAACVHAMDSLALRRGFVMDIALAGVVRAPAQQFSGSTLSQYAAWITPSWLGSGAAALGVLRLGYDRGQTTNRTVFDAGVRALRRLEQFQYGGEAILRYAQGDSTEGTYYRAGITFEAKLTQDIWLTSTLGRNYQPSKEGGLLAVLNFQWNVGKPTLESPSELARGSGK